MRKESIACDNCERIKDRNDKRVWIHITDTEDSYVSVDARIEPSKHIIGCESSVKCPSGDMDYCCIECYEERHPIRKEYERIMKMMGYGGGE